MERNDAQTDRGGGGLSTQDLLEAEPRKEQGPKEQGNRLPRERLPREKLPRDTSCQPRRQCHGFHAHGRNMVVNSVNSGR